MTYTELKFKITSLFSRRGNRSIKGAEVAGILNDLTDKIKETGDIANSTAKSLIWQAPVADFASLSATYPAPQPGWAAMVQSEAVIYSYNGNEWKSTGLTAFAKDVALKGGTEKTLKEVEDDFTRSLAGKLEAADLEPYAKTGGSVKTVKEVEDDLVQLAGDVSNFSAITETSKSVNLFNPANIGLDNYVSNGTDAGILVAAGWKVAKFNIDSIEPYTISGWNSGGNTIAFFSDDVPLPLSTRYVIGLIKSGNLTDVGQPSKVGGKVTITPPEGTKCVIITVKNALEDDSVYQYLQVEKGIEASEYIPYGDKQIKHIKKEYLTEAIGNSNKTIEDLEKETAQISDDISNIYEKSASPNLFNPANIGLDNYVSNGTDAGILVAAGWKVAKFNIDSIEPYTISGWNSGGNTIAFFSDDVPLPLSTRYVIGLIKSGNLTDVGQPSKVGGKVTITPPEGTKCVIITVKNALEDDSVYQYLQVEKGIEASEYIPYGYIYKLKQGLFPSKDKPVKNIFLRKIGNQLLIRTSFNNTQDLVREISLNGSALGQNGASNLLSSKLIKKSDDIKVSGILFHRMNDTFPAPFQLKTAKSGSHQNIGGNHGLPSIQDITTPSYHNKTESDLLSTWVDTNGNECYLVEILSETSLRLAMKPNIEGKISDVSSPISHVSGATNVAAIEFTGNLYDFKPAIRDISVKVFVDDIEIISDGDYECDVLRVIDKHIVADPTEPNLVVPYLPQNNGALSENILIHTVTKHAYVSELLSIFKKAHTSKNISAVQPQQLTKGAFTSMKAYSMNVADKDGYSFDNGIDLSSYMPAYLYIYKSNLKNQTSHFQQLSEILYEDSTPKIGMGAGYLPIGFGKSENQLLNTTIFSISSANKYYPYGKTGTVQQNELTRGIGFISYWDASINPDLSMCFAVPYGSDYFLYLKLRSDATNLHVKLPTELLNRLFIKEWDGGLNFLTEEFTTNEGLIISGNLGDYAILRII